MLREIEEQQLSDIWKLSFAKENPEWKKWDAPYLPYKKLSFEQFKLRESSWYLSNNVKAIWVDNKIIGIVSKTWLDENTRWLEVGIVIYDANYWNGGYGTKDLKKWLEEIFLTTENLEHIGLTTWSRNIRMMKVAEKLGMTKEAVIRKVRYYNGAYYDSIKYGVLRDEWF